MTAGRGLITCKLRSDLQIHFFQADQCHFYSFNIWSFTSLAHFMTSSNTQNYLFSAFLPFVTAKTERRARNRWQRCEQKLRFKMHSIFTLNLNIMKHFGKAKKIEISRWGSRVCIGEPPVWNHICIERESLRKCARIPVPVTRNHYALVFKHGSALDKLIWFSFTFPASCSAGISYTMNEIRILLLISKLRHWKTNHLNGNMDAEKRV